MSANGIVPHMPVIVPHGNRKGAPHQTESAGTAALVIQGSVPLKGKENTCRKDDYRCDKYGKYSDCTTKQN